MLSFYLLFHAGLLPQRREMPAGRVQCALGLHAGRNRYNSWRRDEQQAAHERAGNLNCCQDILFKQQPHYFELSFFFFCLGSSVILFDVGGKFFFQKHFLAVSFLKKTKTKIRAWIMPGVFLHTHTHTKYFWGICPKILLTIFVSYLV